MAQDHPDEKAAYEARLQRRLGILKKQFDADKVRIAEGLQVVESLKQVRYAPDGTVDLATTDSTLVTPAMNATAGESPSSSKPGIGLP